MFFSKGQGMGEESHQKEKLVVGWSWKNQFDRNFSGFK